jgi:chromate reductase, NAD(P)H dehydrogenase (quinone)
LKEEKKNILTISGSIRSNSSNAQIVDAVIKKYSNNFNFSICNTLYDLPHFNPDLDNETPPKLVVKFRKEIEQSDGIFIITPEYVFSIPAVLKNAIEWLVSTTLFTGKPTVIITASTSGLKAHDSLLLIMETIGAKFNKQSTLLIPAVKTRVNKEGKIIDQSLLLQIDQLMENLKKSL